MLQELKRRPRARKLRKKVGNDISDFMQEVSKSKIKLFSSLKLKKNRQKQRLFLVEGRKLVEEAIQSGWKIEHILLREDQADSFILPQSPSCPIQIISSEDFTQVHTLQQAEGILAILRLPETSDPLPPKGPAFLLEEIQDPGNMGTLIRTSAWFGFPRIYLSKGCVDPFNPKALRASMGGIFRLEVCHLDSWQEQIQERRSPLFVAHMEGEILGKIQMPGDALILLGNEARGINPYWLNQKEATMVQIPGRGDSESLNAALSGAILAWELFKTGKNPL